MGTSRPLAIAALVAAAAALFVSPGALASAQHPTLVELEGEIMCPTCHTTLDMSNSLEAQRIERFIAERIAAGDTKSEIKTKLVAQFGEAILAAPRWPASTYWPGCYRLEAGSPPRRSLRPVPGIGAAASITSCPPRRPSPRSHPNSNAASTRSSRATSPTRGEDSSRGRQAI